MNIGNSYMINPSARRCPIVSRLILPVNWQGRTAFFWIPFCSGMLIWTYFRLPEFKHRSYYELDILFEKRIPARRFKGTVVEANAETDLAPNSAHTGVA